MFFSRSNSPARWMALSTSAASLSAAIPPSLPSLCDRGNGKGPRLASATPCVAHAGCQAYTINDESVYMIVENIPALGVIEELLGELRKHGDVDE